MARTIRVDDEVYNALQRRARPFEDSPNSVLRKVLGLDSADDRSMTPEDGVASSVASAATEDSTALREERNMATNRFDDDDRDVVKSFVEKQLNVELTARPPRRKLFHDQNKNLYCFVGGQYFHGIPDDVFKSDAANIRGGKLIIALVKGNKINVYATPLQIVITNDDKLSCDEDEGERKIHIEWRNGQQPSIKKIPEARLAFLGDIERPQQSGRLSPHGRAASRALESLTPEQREALLKKFREAGA